MPAEKPMTRPKRITTENVYACSVVKFTEASNSGTQYAPERDRISAFFFASLRARVSPAVEIQANNVKTNPEDSFFFVRRRGSDP